MQRNTNRFKRLAGISLLFVAAIPPTIQGKDVSSKEKAKAAESKLSRFVSLKREAFGSTKLISDEGWTPSLTLGTLVRQTISEEEGKYSYFYCLQVYVCCF